MWKKSCRWFLIGLVFAAVPGGCRPALRFPVAAVSGRVTLDGMPAARVKVQFSPLGSTEVGPPSVATAAGDGRFTLVLARQNAGAGAVVGEHVVTISGLESYDELIEAIRAQEKGSSKAASADPGQVPTLTLPREADLPTVRVPKRYQRSLRFTVPKQGTDAANFDLTAK